jgi:hypothetical protein
MKSTLSLKTQNYLIESLNKRITCDLNREFYESVTLTEAGGAPGSGTGTSGSGGGTGISPSTGSSSTGPSIWSRRRPANPVPGVKVRKTSLGSKSTLFGNSNINMAGAMGMYGAGKALSGLASMAKTAGGLAGTMLPRSLTNLPIIGPAAKFAAGLPGDLAAGMLSNLADLSGANYFDANVKKMGLNQVKLAAQGAGKPWVPLEIPEPNEIDTESPTQKAIKAAKEQEEANALRAKGYKIP